jgi:hypothetical protein
MRTFSTQCPCKLLRKIKVFQTFPLPNKPMRDINSQSVCALTVVEFLATRLSPQRLLSKESS